MAAEATLPPPALLRQLIVGAVDDYAALIRAGAENGASPGEAIAHQVDQALLQLGLREVQSRPALRSLSEILADPTVLEPPAELVRSWAWRGRLTLHSSREKDGKSTRAAAATAEVTRNGGTVLLVALEEHVGDIATRAVRWGTDPERLYIIDAAGLGNDPLGAIAAACLELKPDLVVIDTLPALVDLLQEKPDSGSSTAWTAIMQPLVRTARSTDAAVVALHHAKKDGGYRDSTAIGANADCILEMEVDKTDPTIRRFKARARWPLTDYALRLIDGDPPRYEFIEGASAPGMEPWRRIIGTVRRYITEHPGCTGAQLREGVRGRGRDVDLAARFIEEDERAVRYVPPERQGLAGRWYPVNLVPPRPDHVPDGVGSNLVPPSHPPRRGGGADEVCRPEAEVQLEIPGRGSEVTT